MIKKMADPVQGPIERPLMGGTLFQRTLGNTAIGLGIGGAISAVGSLGNFLGGNDNVPDPVTAMLRTGTTVGLTAGAVTLGEAGVRAGLQSLSNKIRSR